MLASAWTMTWALLWAITPVAFLRAAKAPFPRLSDRIGITLLLQIVTLGLALLWSPWVVVAAFILIALTLLIDAVDAAED